MERGLAKGLGWAVYLLPVLTSLVKAPAADSHVGLLIFAPVAGALWLYGYGELGRMERTGWGLVLVVGVPIWYAGSGTAFAFVGLAAMIVGVLVLGSVVGYRPAVRNFVGAALLVTAILQGFLPRPGEAFHLAALAFLLLCSIAWFALRPWLKRQRESFDPAWLIPSSYPMFLLGAVAAAFLLELAAVVQRIASQSKM